MIDSTLSSYRITAKLGEGGMGEVWRAVDEKLGREVALKLLPEAVAGDPERLSRFEREAKLLASLDHPNIATLYGLEEHEGRAFLVMQLVEGLELAEVMDGGPVPVDEAIRIADGIAAALEAAHSAGVVHRDLKPANVRLTSDGKVKVLDFGLAKAWQADDDDPARQSLSPTITRHATAAGVILGTAAYMSPEQAKGQPVDQRADVWAFGVVLWEMLTGRRLFSGDGVSEVMAEVLRADIDLEAVPATTPGSVRRLLRRCLERDPSRRLRDLGDARLELAEREERELMPVPRSSRQAWWLAGLLVVVAGVGLFSHLLRPPVKAPTTRLSLTLPRGMTVAHGFNDLKLAVSPNGRQVVVAVGDADGTHLYLRDLGRDELRLLPGTLEASNPFFDPDGEWLGFSRASAIMKLKLDGGRPVEVASQAWGGAVWHRDGTIIFTPAYNLGLHRIPAAGGESQELTVPDLEQGELNHGWPDLLPSGEGVVFTSFRLPIEESRIELLDLVTGTRKVLVDHAAFARVLAPGHLIFVRDRSLMAVGFHTDTGEIHGQPVPVIEDMHIEATEASSQLAVSAEGTLAYIPSSVLRPPRSLVWVDRSGATEPITAETRLFRDPSLSPDGRRVAVTTEEEGLDLWVLDIERQTLTRLTSSARSELNPVWHPDGDRLLLTVDVPPFDTYVVPADGSGSPVPLYESPRDCHPGDVTADGEWFVGAENFGAGRGYDLIRVPMGGGEPEVLRTSRFRETVPAVSPDGRWLAYAADDSGRTEVFIQAYPSGGGRVQVSRAGGARPIWARETGELFFVSGDHVMVVEVEDSASGIRVGEPRRLFTLRAHFVNNDLVGWDVTPDGQRFVMISVPAEDLPREVLIVQNWAAEVEKRVPSGG